MKSIIVIFLTLLVCPLMAETTSVPESISAALGLPMASIPKGEIETLWLGGQKKEARQKLDLWLSKEKQTPWPWVLSARMQCDEKKFKKCISMAEVALAKAPDCAEAYYWKGRGLEGLGKLLDAANEYRAALAGKNKFLEAQKDLDRVSSFLGNEH